MNSTTPHPLFAAWPRWTLQEEPLGESTALNIRRDSDLLRQQAQYPDHPIARIWENPRSLVVTRRETRLPTYAAACRALDAAGWPVVVRDSGGTAVPHEPGVIHLSLIYRQPAQLRYDIDRSYQALCEPIRLALASLGIEPDYGTVPGAYCDGRYNLVVGGRKITGTAQRLVPMAGGGQAVLSQAMVNVTTDALRGTDIVNRFYQLAGDSRRYRGDASTSLDALLPEQPPTRLLQLFRQRLLDALARLTGGSTPPTRSLSGNGDRSEIPPD